MENTRRPQQDAGDDIGSCVAVSALPQEPPSSASGEALGLLRKPETMTVLILPTLPKMAE